MKIVKRKNGIELHNNPIELDEIVFLEKEKVYLKYKKIFFSKFYCGDHCFFYYKDNCPKRYNMVACRYGYCFEQLSDIEVLILNDKE